MLNTITSEHYFFHSRDLYLLTRVDSMSNIVDTRSTTLHSTIILLFHLFSYKGKISFTSLLKAIVRSSKISDYQSLHVGSHWHFYLIRQLSLYLADFKNNEAEFLKKYKKFYT